MIVAVHQPDFLPYLGFFRKMFQADTFVVYDTAQYSKNGYHNRNRIKSPNGSQWITVPIRRSGLRAMKDVDVDNSRKWPVARLKTIEANYRNAPYFETYFDGLSEALTHHYDRLVELNMVLLRLVSGWLGIEKTIVRSSQLPEPSTTDPTEKLLHFTRACGGSVYLAGPGGRDYLKEDKFDAIRLEYSRFIPKPYPQLFGAFIPDLSVIDAVFNCGESAKQLVES